MIRYPSDETAEDDPDGFVMEYSAPVWTHLPDGFDKCVRVKYLIREDYRGIYYVMRQDPERGTVFLKSPCGQFESLGGAENAILVDLFWED